MKLGYCTFVEINRRVGGTRFEFMTQVFNHSSRRTGKGADVSSIAKVAELFERIPIALGSTLGDMMGKEVNISLVQVLTIHRVLEVDPETTRATRGSR